MKKLYATGLVVLLGWAITATAQVPSNDETAPLVLVRIIAMPDVQGRFDHMGVDNKSNRVFAAVYGNDSVEVLDVARGRRVHTMQAEFVKPQMALYIADLNRIVVSNEGDGACKVFDADTYKLLDTVKFPDDADQLRYDSKTKRVYVGYGDGAIGAFDATTNKRVEGDFELGAHPESFQLEEKGSRIFVNLASISEVAVIDRNILLTEGGVFRPEDELRGTKLEVMTTQQEEAETFRVVEKWNVKVRAAIISHDTY